MDTGVDAANAAIPEPPGPAVPLATTRTPASRRRASWSVVLLALVLAAVAAAAYGTGYAYLPAAGSVFPDASSDLPSEPAALRQLQNKLERRHRQLLAALDRKAPRGMYVVIDQTQNRLYLMKDDQVLREAVCSAGSGMILKEGEGGKGRRWVFDTPRGAFHVLSKMADPVWKKPDWAFVEEGKPIPKNDADRFDPAALGEYALYFGNGYMIHGTLYERLLGRSVTHGCIRLGREDLREVYKQAPIGTPIFIY